MSKESAVSAIVRGGLSELQHVLEESEWDIGSEPLDSKGQTALHIACANGHLDIVQYLVNKKGCSVTVENVNGHTPLILSFINKHWKMANFLLQFVPDSVFNGLGGGIRLTSYNMSIMMELAKEALIVSCKEGYFELVKYLIKSIWHTVDDKEIIKLARCFDNLQIVKYLLTHCQCTMPDDMSEVHIACIQGVVEKVQVALDINGSSILGTADSFGTTPIHYATLEPNLLRMIIQLHHARGMVLNITDGKGNTPLHHSIKYECIESVTILVEAPGCDVNIANLKGETPLIAACKYSNSAIVQVLVANERCDINTSDSGGQTALHIACANGHQDIVQYLVNKKGCSVTVKDVDGYTPLILSLINKHWKIANLLLQHALNSVNQLKEMLPITHKNSTVMKAAEEALVMSCKNGYFVLVKYLTDHIPHSVKALQIARSSGNLHIVRYLLKHYQCDIPDDMSDVHLACMMGDMDTVKTAVEIDGLIMLSITDHFGTTPIHYATLEPNVLRMIVQYAGEMLLNITDSMENTPLHHSIKYECIESVTILVEAPGCNVNIANLKEETPLIAACKYSNSDIVQLLAASERCDLNTYDSEGQTALHIACAHGHLDIVQYLVNKKGCSVIAEDVYGHSPLMLSLINKHWKMANLLLQHALNSVNQLEEILPIIYSNSTILKAAKEALLMSCKNGHIVLVKYLTDHIPHSEEALQIARSSGNLHIVRNLLKHSQCKIPDDMSDVYLACMMGDMDTVKTALETDGPSMLSIANCFGTTPIHYATLEPNVLRMIVQYAGEMLLNITDSRGNTPLHHSIKYECIESVTILVGAPGCDVNIANLKGETPLIAACKHGNSDIVQLLLKYERHDINSSDNKGNTALHIAISSNSSGRLENVQCLLQSDRCDPNVNNNSGCTPLHIVCRRGVIPLLEALVADKRCDLNIQDGNGDTALHIGVENVEVVKCLLESGRSRCDICNEKGLTPFHKAIANGNMSSVKVMLKNGVNILQTSNDEFKNPTIHIAFIYSRLDILKVLLSCTNCDPNQQNAVGDTALHIVCRMRTGNELQFLEVLTSTPGINPTLLNLEGNAAIHTACMNSRLESLKVLLSCESCDPNQQNTKGDTALHNVCRMRTGSELQFLQVLTSTPGINPTLLNLEGNAPIHTACMNSRLESLKVLLSCESCDPNQQNTKGDTALHNVCRMRTGSELQFLQVLTSTPGINPTLLNLEGNAPIHTACMNSRLESLKVLLSCESCDPNQQNSKGDTPLHIVCRMRTGRELQLLEVLYSTPGINTTLVNHEGFAPCDVVGIDGNTLLHIACAEGNTAIVELLVKNGVNALTLNHEGNAPIHTACMNSRLESLKVLLSCESCDPNQQNTKGDTALHIVCRMRTGSELQFLQVLTSTSGINPTLLNLEGNAAIHTACMNSRLESLKVLLSCESCDPNQQNSKGDTPLHIVCRMRTGNELQLLDLLTSTPGINTTLVNHEGFAPCDVVGIDGNTLLHIACAEGNTAIVELLVKNGVNALTLNHEGNAPIHTACMNSRLESLKVLLSRESCNPNQQNAEGDTALHIVCRMGINEALPCFQVLITTPGINVNVVNHDGLVPFEQLHKNGMTFLHNACAEGMYTVVDLLVKNGAYLLKPDRYGDAPIHIACRYSRLGILRVLLVCTYSDPNQQNAKGDTALHIVCKMRTGRELPFLEVLTSTPGINPRLVNHEGMTPFDVVDSDGNTLLHIACAEGNVSLVELLMKNGADVLKPNRHKDAPIHTACQLSRLDILKMLLESRDCDPNQQNGSGDMPLHIVCRMSRGSKLPFLKMLLSTPGINPEIVNLEGRTPIEVAGTNYFAIDAIKKFLEHKKSSIQAYLKIFVVGNSGNGKSTLIKAVTTEASQLRKYSPLSKMKHVNPSDVPPHTAGIVPIPFNSKHFGNAVLYDFAGQHEYYSSHAAVMENLILPSPPLFLLLIDISKSKKIIRKELVYWWHFINNQRAATPPHVILAGSHKDMVKSGDREELEVKIRDWIKGIPVSFEFVGYFPLDCRKLVSQGLNALLTQLNTTCQTLRGIVDVNLHCHILNALLRAPEFQDLVYCRISDIMSRIQSDNALLPQAFSQLIPLLASLNDQGHILLLQNHTDESKSCVILKPDVLLTEVNGSIFAPKYFKEHSEFAMSTGVVTLSKLTEKFTEYNDEVIVEYLTHLEFCFRIKDQHTLDMITKYEAHRSITTEEYYFFPSLVRVENPTDVCQPHESIGYECGWLYKCSKETEQLTTRFLHVLILRLAFACDPPDDPTETESVVLLRSCSVWKHGIAWWTNDGIEVIVEVGLQCRWVAVMLRCPDVKMVECAELRSKVIHTVLKAKTDFCPTITMREYLIAPSSLKYPFEGRELTLYSMREVARATIEGKDYARDTEGKNPITIPQLLPFEPYHNMGNLVSKFFNENTSVAVTSEDLTQIAVKCYEKLAELKTAFKPDIGSFQEECVKADTEVKRCVALFHILQRRGRFKTWRDFQQEFRRFSIFCEQSPLVSMTVTMLNAQLNSDPVVSMIQQTSLCFFVMRFCTYIVLLLPTGTHTERQG